MRTSILAIIVAFGTTIVVPALAQQQPTAGQQEEADKGIKTRNSGESGYVGEQEKPGASSHVPGQPDTKSNQTTTGASSAVGKSGGVSVDEQEKKTASPAESSQTTSGKPR
jgi:type II secretory pathway pseudopilin PulG